MKRRILAFGLLLSALLVGSVAAGGPCPAGTIATDSEMVTGVKLGTIVVEVCVTRMADADTYSYRVTNLGLGLTNICGLLITGAGKFTTVDTGVPLGWASSRDGTSSECATWWTWSTLGGVPGAGIRPGETATFSITLEGPTTPADVPARLAPCVGDIESFRILGPSACADVTDAGLEQSCVCTSHGCSGVNAFEGDGTRIRIVGGPDTQVIGQCDPSWVRHGWSGEEPIDAEFRLFIDGVPVTLNEETICVASSSVGTASVHLYWCTKLPAFFFDVGTYALTGQWELFPSPELPGGFLFDRTITLVVEPCAPEPLPLTPLPDLTVEIADVSCRCSWNPQQERECALSVSIVVRDEGAAPTDVSNVEMIAGSAMAVTAIPPLGIQEAYRTELEASLIAGDDVSGPCPLDVEVAVDFTDMVAESNEDNNEAETELCCK